MHDTPPGKETKGIKCPMCGIIMTATANSNLFLCPEKRRIYLQQFRESVDYYDCALEIHTDGGFTFQQYEVPPYKIVIKSPRIYVSPLEWGTHVTMIKTIRYDEHLGLPEPLIQWQNVFDTTEILNLPWHDRERCLEKLKLLTTFS